MDTRLFSDFLHRLPPSDMEQCIDLFAVFGGLDVSLDLGEPIEALIRRHILERYDELHAAIYAPLQENPLLYGRLLHAISVGDRRLDSAYRRARIGRERGSEAFAYLRRIGYLIIEHSRETPPVRLHPKQRFKKEVRRHRISHKLRFSTPFLRFWFAFVEPYADAIRERRCEAMLEYFSLHHNAFVGFVFEELCDLYIQEVLSRKFETQIIESGSYWDREVEIDLLCDTLDAETWIGECKWTNHKVNKKELNLLEEKSLRLGIDPDKILLFTKRGFSKELTHLKDPRLYLFCAEDLSVLAR